MTDSGNEGTIYELAYLVTPLLPEAGLEAEVATLKKGIEAAGGTVLSEEAAKMRPLAYTITRKIANKNVRFSEAYFGWMQFQVLPSSLSSVEELLQKDENLVRHLLIVAPKEQEVSEKDEAASKDGELEAEKGELTDQELDREIDQMIAA